VDDGVDPTEYLKMMSDEEVASKDRDKLEDGGLT
jgi:hypothetical protein